MADKKYLICESHVEQDVNLDRSALYLDFYMFLNERFVYCVNDRSSECWTFEILDLFTEESREVKFYIPSNQYRFDDIIWLNSDFGLITSQSDATLYVNLVKIDWMLNELQTVEQFERHGQELQIFPDSLDQSKFLLFVEVGNVYTYQICDVIKGKIQFGQIHRSQNLFSNHFNNKLFGLSRRGRQGLIKIFDLATKNEESFETGPLLDDVNVLEDSFVAWGYERLYMPIRYQNAETYGITWLDLKTRQWQMLDFETRLRIEYLKFSDGNLLVHTEQSNENGGIFSLTKKFYNIQMRRPRLLRDSAWLLAVKTMKEKNEPDPYGTLMMYLPLNTDIRSPWFVDKEENDEKSAEVEQIHMMGSPDQASKDETSKDESDRNSESSIEDQRVKTQEEQPDKVPANRPKSNQLWSSFKRVISNLLFKWR